MSKLRGQPDQVVGTYGFCSALLDELREFGLNLIEVLHQPHGGMPREVSISRANGTVTYPANFMLVAAQNPCPCGYFGAPAHTCSCSNSMITRYQKRISGPLLDRVNISVDVPRADFDKLTASRRSESSLAIRDRVEAARKRQEIGFRLPTCSVMRRWRRAKFIFFAR